MKECSRCGKELPATLECFYKKADSKDGLCPYCKQCNIEQANKWRKDNMAKARLNGRNYISKHRSEHNARGRRWHQENHERSLANSHRYGAAHKTEKREWYKKWIKEKRATEPKYALRHNIEVALRTSLKENKAGRQWETLLGFTVDQLKKHLEKLFTPEMNWNNYGTYWQIDHKVPIAVFNFERPDDIDFHLCWSLKNLQPLEASENMSKGAKIEKPFQPSLALAV